MLLAFLVFSQSSLTGKISDRNGMPLQGASVVISPQAQGTFADAAGHYSFKNLKKGIYIIEATYVGFEKNTKIISIREKQKNVLLNIQLTEDESILDEITVLATRAADKSPFTYTNLDKEAIESRNLGQDIPFLLDATPSVVVSSDAGAGIGYTGMRIRGTDPTRTNVTINGIPLNDAESQGVFWVDLPDFASSTNDIQIQRGVGTSTNGAGAFGATISLNTGKLNTEPYAKLSGTLGSFNTLKSTASFGSGVLNNSSIKNHKSTGFTFDGRLSKISSEGYIDRADVDMEAYYISGAYIGNKNSIRANVFSGHEITYQAWNGVPAQWVEDKKLRTYNVSGTEKSNEYPHDNEVDDYTQTHYQLLFAQKLNRNWNLNVNGHYTRGFGFFEQYKANENLTSDYGLNSCDTCINNTDLIRRRWLDNNFYGGVWSLSHVSNGQNIQTTFGGAWNQYKGDHFGEITWAEQAHGLQQNERYYFGTGDKTDFNVYGKTLYNITPNLIGFVDLQFRKVAYEISGTDNDLRETNAILDYNFFNPKIGATYLLDNKTSAYVSFAVANREPNRNDFTDAGTGIQPQPERLYDTEAGINFKNKEGLFGVNIYHMQYKDQLALTGNINDVGSAVRVNVPDSYRVGLEMMGSILVNKKITIEANASFSKNKIKNFTEYVDNWDTGLQEVVSNGTTNLAFSPNIIAFGKINYDLIEGLSVSLSAKHVGEQFIDNTSNENTILEAYTIGGFQMRYVLNPLIAKEISLNLLVNNILDKKYSTNAWTYRYVSEGYDGRADNPYTQSEGNGVYNLTGYYPQAGRNFLLGLTVNF